MKASELRIGNIVLKDDKSNGVKEVDAEFFSTVIDGEIVGRGVPINAKRLLELNFTKDEEGHYLRGSGEGGAIIIAVEKEKGKFVFSANVNDSGDLIELFKQPMFVHELQNLYFALTGKEILASKGKLR